MEREIIEVSGCATCPFSNDEYDDYSCGNNTTDTCSLLAYQGMLSIINSRNMEDEQPNEMPENCPLKGKEIVVKIVNQ